MPSGSNRAGEPLTEKEVHLKLCAGSLVVAGMKRLTAVVALVAASCSPHQQPSNDTVFVSNETGGVMMVDGATGRIEGQLAAGHRPRGMEFSPDRRTLYVAASNDNRIEAWDLRTRKLLRTYASGTDPERFAISPDGGSAYIANEDHSAVSFLDLKSGRLTREVAVGPEPEGVGVSPDGKLVIATSEVANLAHFIDTATGKLLDSVPVGSRPRFVLFLNGGRIAWVSSEQRGTITVFDTRTRKVVRTIDLARSFDIDEPVQAVEMRALRNGSRVYVAMGRANRVAELDPASGKVLRWWPTALRTWGIGLSPDETRLYAASGLGETLTIIDLRKGDVVRTIKLGGRPWGAVAAPR
ncbi:MAG: PQQ-dependent catabolism-associated beta-propeller protein [Sphingomicrobium sp.]